MEPNQTLIVEEAVQIALMESTAMLIQIVQAITAFQGIAKHKQQAVAGMEKLVQEKTVNPKMIQTMNIAGKPRKNATL